LMAVWSTSYSSWFNKMKLWEVPKELCLQEGCKEHRRTENYYKPQLMWLTIWKKPKGRRFTMHPAISTIGLRHQW
jgi:hypothetical protein